MADDSFPISIRMAARRLAISDSRAKRLVRNHAITHRPSSLNGKAKMLDAAAFDRLRRLVAEPLAV